MKKQLQLLIMLASFGLLGITAWAAEPFAVWEASAGDFSNAEKATQGGLTFSANENKIDATTGALIIGGEAAPKFEGTPGLLNECTLFIQGEDFPAPSSGTDYRFIAEIYGDNFATAPAVGVAVTNNRYYRLWTHALATNTYWTRTPHAADSVLVITFYRNNPENNAKKGVRVREITTNSETGERTIRDLSSDNGLFSSSTAYSDFTIGMPYSEISNVSAATDWKIKHVAVFSTAMTTEEEMLAYIFPLEIKTLSASETTASVQGYLTADSALRQFKVTEDTTITLTPGETFTKKLPIVVTNGAKLTFKSTGDALTNEELNALFDLSGVSADAICYAWAQTRTAMLESGANITSWAEMGWDTIPSDTDNVVITLKGDATLNLATPQTIGEVTIQKAEDGSYDGTATKPTLTINGTLCPSKVTVNGAVYTLAGTSDSSEETPAEIAYPIVDGTNPGGIKVTSGVVKLTAATHTGGTQIDSNATLIYNDGATICEIDGQGTLSLIGWIPSNAQLTLADTWKGVVKISDYGMNSNAASLAGLSALANNNSTLEVSDVRGYVNKSDNLTISHLKISENKYFQLWNGTATESKRAVIQVNKLSGTGTFKWTGYPNPNSDVGWAYTVKIVDVCDFSGQFEKNATPIDGDDATAIVIGGAADSTTGTNKKITFCGNVSFNATTVPTFEAEDGIAFAEGTTINVKLLEAFTGSEKVLSTTGSVEGFETATVNVQIGSNPAKRGTLSQTEDGLYVTIMSSPIPLPEDNPELDTPQKVVDAATSTTGISVAEGVAVSQENISTDTETGDTIITIGETVVTMPKYYAVTVKDDGTGFNLALEETEVKPVISEDVTITDDEGNETTVEPIEVTATGFNLAIPTTINDVRLKYTFKGAVTPSKDETAWADLETLTGNGASYQFKYTGPSKEGDPVYKFFKVVVTD